MPIKLTLNKIYFTCLAAILSFNSLTAQSKFEPGTIIALNGDSIHGFILNENWNRNPDQVQFKESMEATEKIYISTEIYGFQVAEDIYHGGIVNINKASERTEHLELKANITLEPETLFVKALVLGPKNLFFVKDNKGKEHFFFKENNQFVTLEYKKYLKKDKKDGTETIAKNERYKGQLLLYLEECPQLKAQIYRAPYKLNPLKKIIEGYYDCQNTNTSYTERPEGARYEFGAVGGISIAAANFSGDGFDHLSENDFSGSLKPSLGMFFDILFPRNHHRLSLYNELLYSSYLFDVSTMDQSNEDSYVKQNIKIGYDYLKLNNMIRYRFPLNTIQLFINGGISNSLLISETNEFHEEKKYYSNFYTKDENAINETRKYEQSWIVGAGAQYEKCGIEYRYERSNGMSVYSGLSSNVKRHYFLFSYRF